MRELAAVGITTILIAIGLYAIDEHSSILVLYVFFGSVGMVTVADQIWQAYKRNLEAQGARGD